MMTLETITKLLEQILKWDIGAYAVLLGFILFKIRRSGYDPVSEYARSRFTLAVDVRFLTQLGKRYSEIFESKTIRIAYEAVLWVGAIGFCVYFALVVVSAVQY